MRRARPAAAAVIAALVLTVLAVRWVAENANNRNSGLVGLVEARVVVRSVAACLAETERREACQSCEGCDQFCSASGECGTQPVVRALAGDAHDCRNRATRAAAARAVAEERFVGRVGGSRDSGLAEAASLRTCYLELDRCEAPFKQAPDSPWTVRAFVNGSAEERLCPKLALRHWDDFCWDPSNWLQNWWSRFVRPACAQGLWPWCDSGRREYEYEPVSLMLEYDDDSVVGPHPLLESGWTEFATPRSAALARVGFHAHTLDHYCGREKRDRSVPLGGSSVVALPVLRLSGRLVSHARARARARLCGRGCVCATRPS